MYALDTALSAFPKEECLLPEPVDFRVEYEEGVSITLSWRASDLPVNRSICKGSDVFEVRSRWYATLEDYNSFILIRGVVDFEEVIGTNYSLNFSQYSVNRSSYFVFDILNIGELLLAPGTRRRETPSPVYYFEMQGMKVLFLQAYLTLYFAILVKSQIQALCALIYVISFQIMGLKIYCTLNFVREW